MKEVTFYRLFFIGILVTSFLVWQIFFPLIEPYPSLEYEAPVIPELPNPRDPSTWEEWTPEFYIDPIFIYIGVIGAIAVLLISIIAYYRRKEEV